MTGAFATTLRGFKWLASRWYIPLLALAVIGAWLVGARRQPRKTLQNELDAIEENERFDRFAIRFGARAANELADQEYRDTLRNITRQQSIKAERLRCNPVSRLRYLRRLTKRLRASAGNNDDS